MVSLEGGRHLYFQALLWSHRFRFRKQIEFPMSDAGKGIDTRLP